MTYEYKPIYGKGPEEPDNLAIIIVALIAALVIYYLTIN